MRGSMLPDDAKGSCVQLLHLYDSSGAEWQLGKTKVSKRMSVTVTTKKVLLCLARFTTVEFHDHREERVKQTNKHPVQNLVFVCRTDLCFKRLILVNLKMCRQRNTFSKRSLTNDFPLRFSLLLSSQYNCLFFLSNPELLNVLPLLLPPADSCSPH